MTKMTALQANLFKQTGFSCPTPPGHRSKMISPSPASWEGGSWIWNELRPSLSSIPMASFAPVLRISTMVWSCPTNPRWDTAAT